VFHKYVTAVVVIATLIYSNCTVYFKCGSRTQHALASSALKLKFIKLPKMVHGSSHRLCSKTFFLTNVLENWVVTVQKLNSTNILL
jgi:hypothetical protein